MKVGFGMNIFVVIVLVICIYVYGVLMFNLSIFLSWVGGKSVLSIIVILIVGYNLMVLC